ncbi:MAG: DVU_1553 family AMP-dependent CoA ligase [Clostridiaceae bacterium]
MSISPIHPWIHDIIGSKTLAEYRLECIRHTMDYASSNSAFYRKHFEGINTDDIKSMEDIAKIPVMSSADIEHNPSALVCVPQSEISRIITLNTSGTTGNPKRIYFTREDMELTVEFFMQGMKTLVGCNDKVLILMPGEKFGSVGYALNEALGRICVFCEIHGVINDFDKCIEDIVKYDINCLVGIPVQVQELSYVAQRKGIKSIDKVLLSADYIPDPVIHNIEKNFGCTAYSHYGMTEMGFGGGVECSAFEGYHLRENDLYFEILDPETGSPLEDGLLGEVAFTTLSRKGMPLIRYRTGDISRFIVGKCGCGSDMRRLDKIRGRKSEFIELAPGIFIGLPELDEEIFKVRGILNYKVKLYRGNPGSAMKLMLKVYPEFKGGQQVLERLMENLKIRAAAAQGLLTILPVEYLDFIECSTGMVKRKIEILEADIL